jgi:hypothetical protein
MPALEEVVAQVDRVVLRDELRGGLHVAGREAIALAQQGGELFHHPLDLRSTLRARPRREVVPWVRILTLNRDSRFRRFSS